ncbi:hypothetical protein Kpol_1023p34 [Vanderwaltozyma polyspora DSM 70294]|uniref:CRIB domain-containing protein n=1 Tax=Vanderwaltozyma polyspora (strain ATCC 22028 / DSM 70294 / BCRC 21397 / CBS 2163 / NBRC 10782 / NRRL Y-8283 / UCD 57-17) TaxID=436907 RepID=A7TFQ7_VANPO|nr:uncharacterized protein Kpol_1023p34 [Vanderwaltozyma polyspora DSM 70294]EDO18865.1 hypothetical protein Kpol_1023p34 [Vanderwaltozyma polyspora DSM 70294]
MEDGVVPTYLLPQMKSIWLDEDEEAEKLYGLQAQQFMAGDDDDEKLGVKMINSNKPLLKNMELIKPLNNSNNFNSNDDEDYYYLKNNKRLSKKKQLINFFKNKEFNGQKLLGKKISSPFGFQHISHAADSSEDELTTEATTNEESKQEVLLPSIDDNEHGGNDSSHPNVPTHTRSLSKAFVTETIPESYNNSTLQSRNLLRTYRTSMGRSVSTSSSQYSKQSTIDTIRTSRITSTVTMATSIADSPVKRQLRTSDSEKKHIDSGYARDSNSSNISLEYLKSYTFPTVLQDKDIFDLENIELLNTATSMSTSDDNDNDNETEHAGEETLLESDFQPSLRDATKSDPNLLASSRLENGWFKKTGTGSLSRKSLDDDILTYYLEPRGLDSPERPSSFRYSSYGKIITQTPPQS